MVDGKERWVGLGIRLPKVGWDSNLKREGHSLQKGDGTNGDRKGVGTSKHCGVGPGGPEIYLPDGWVEELKGRKIRHVREKARIFFRVREGEWTGGGFQGDDPAQNPVSSIEVAFDQGKKKGAWPPRRKGRGGGGPRRSSWSCTRRAMMPSGKDG